MPMRAIAALTTLMQTAVPDIASRLMGLIAVTFGLLILLMLIWLKRREVEERETEEYRKKARSSADEQATDNA